MKLTKTHSITGLVRCDTGLHIGGSTEEMEIGGVDNPIIKHPITKEPFIPGSSLKGKMRSLLERNEGKVSPDGKPCGCGNDNCLVCRIFGPHMNTNHRLGPTRILVRDGFFAPDTKKKVEQLLKEKGQSFIETKTENVINRNTGTAEHPRTQERVPAGAEFDLELALHVYEGDDEKAMLDFVKKGIRLIQEDYLGGYGSRGSGKVSFHNLKIDGNPFTL